MDKDDWITKLRKVLDYVKDWTDVQGLLAPRVYDARCEAVQRRGAEVGNVPQIQREMMGGRSLVVGTALRRDAL